MNLFHRAHRAAAALALLAGLWAAPWAAAQDKATAPAAPASAAAPGPGTEYSAKGADSCYECHDAEADTATFVTNGIFKSRHGTRRGAHSPFGPGGLQCEACHGPGARHGAKGSKTKLTINSQKADSFMSAAERNAPCMECHADGPRNGWHAGAHASAQLGCSDCHQLHSERDAVRTKTGQAEVCLRCHKEQRADFMKTSSHPVRQGRMTCTDCHNVHGSSGPSTLIKPTINQTCYTCHAEKRGPVLWEHAPVTEDCSLCHDAHGSVRNAMLTKSTPLLCQQCHSPAGHPAVARTPGGLPVNGGTGALFLVAGSCTNCHSQVHGSNHPAGAKLMR